MRLYNLIGFAGCVGAVLFAYLFLEKYLGLVPCPLCILDRLVLLAMAIIFLAGSMVRGNRGQVTLWCANVFVLAWGFVFSGRHVWLQNKPFDPNRPCLSNSAEIAGITDFLAVAFDANADCGTISLELLGISIPGYTFILFVLLLGFLAFQAWLMRKMGKLGVQGGGA